MRQNSEKIAMKRSVLVLSTMGLLWSTFAYARYAEPQHGKEILQKLCARCHAVGRTGAIFCAKPHSTPRPAATPGRQAEAEQFGSTPNVPHGTPAIEVPLALDLTNATPAVP